MLMERVFGELGRAEAARPEELRALGRRHAYFRPETGPFKALYWETFGRALIDSAKVLRKRWDSLELVTGPKTLGHLRTVADGSCFESKALGGNKSNTGRVADSQSLICARCTGAVAGTRRRSWRGRSWWCS